MNKKALKNFPENYFSTFLFLWGAYFLYTRSSFHINFIGKEVSIWFLNINLEIQYVFHAILFLYIILLIPYYLVYHEDSKARIILGYFKKAFSWDRSYTEKERVALLAWVVKLFFIPLMITWLTQHIFSLVNNWHGLLQNTAMIQTDFLWFFDGYFFWTMFSSILFFDVLFFTLGYLIEMPVLKNTIKSVEPTLLWWAVAILCYPPFNEFTGELASWYSTDFPEFWTPWVHVSMNILILFLMGIYARASLALWFKASNLTNRWIVKKWPYKYIRHPAYICKNTAWIIWGLPMVYYASTHTDLALSSVLLGLASWAFLYYLRAMTEENHLSADPDYVAYKKEVKYKFIPGVW